MELGSEVRPGNNRFISGTGVLKELTEYLADFDKVAVVTGEKSFEVFKDFYQADFDYPVYRYDGSASYEDGQAIADEIGSADAILGIGGGRVCDTAKFVSENLNCDVVLVPTLISNCAPFTPITAVYHPDRTFRKIGYQKRAPYLTLVDWEFLLATPVDYFVAGIGDTLAKWYEIEGITRNLAENKKTAYIRLGIACAKEIRNILVTDSKEAVRCLKDKELSPAFARVTDTIIALAGETGGFAGTYGRSAGAHAIHNGLSYITATHDQLHGKKVAYGILVQLAYTKDFDEIKNVYPFYQATGLPTKLAELNVVDTSREALRGVVEHAAADDFVMIDKAITADGVFEAIQAVEAF